jgi:hypothetical protein
MVISTSQDVNLPTKGFTIRLANADIAHLQHVANAITKKSLNKLLAEMVRDIVYLCDSIPFHLKPEGLIIKSLSHPFLAESWHRIAQNDLRRSLPNSSTKSYKLTFDEHAYGRLLRISKGLDFALSKLVLTALQTFCALAGAQRPLEEESIPLLIRLIRGERLWMGRGEYESANLIAKHLNKELGLIPAGELKTEASLIPFETNLELL